MVLLAPEFNEIIEYTPLSEQQLESGNHPYDLDKVIVMQKVSMDFIDQRAKHISWYRASIHQDLTEEMMHKYRHRLDWRCASIYQKMTEEFIEKMEHYVFWEDIFEYQNLSDEFRKKHQHRIQ